MTFDGSDSDGDSEDLYVLVEGIKAMNMKDFELQDHFKADGSTTRSAAKKIKENAVRGKDGVKFYPHCLHCDEPQNGLLGLAQHLKKNKKHKADLCKIKNNKKRAEQEMNETIAAWRRSPSQLESVKDYKIVCYNHALKKLTYLECMRGVLKTHRTRKLSI